MSEPKADIDKSQMSDGFHTFAELYRERSALTALLARICLKQNVKVGAPPGTFVGIAKDERPGFNGFRTVLYIDFPSGQVSWHFSDEDAAEFLEGMPTYRKPYDGHTTAEKYERVEKVARTVDGR